MNEEKKNQLRQQLEKLMAQFDEVKISAKPFEEPMVGPVEQKWPVAAKHYMLSSDRKTLRRLVRSMLAYIMHLYFNNDLDYLYAEPLMKLCSTIDEDLSDPRRKRLQFEVDALPEVYGSIDALQFRKNIFERIE